MLPTLGFILCAYGLYALCRVWTRRTRRQLTPYRQWRRRRQLTLVGGTGVGLGIILLVAIVGLPSHYENLKYASIISASWGHDSWQPGQVMPRPEILPLNTQGDPGRPVYAYLHPETPPAQLLADKNAPPSKPPTKRRLRKPVKHAKSPKAKTGALKKVKATGKHRLKARSPKSLISKKKKTHRAPAKLAATSH